MLKRNWALLAFVYLALAEALSLAPVPDLSLCLIEPEHGQQSADHDYEKFCPAFHTGAALAFEKIDSFLEHHDKSVVGGFTIVLAISTIGLWMATNRLWSAGEKQRDSSERIAERQRRSSERVACWQRMSDRSANQAAHAGVAIAKRSLITTQRAFVYIDGFNIELTTAADSSAIDNAILPERFRDDPGLFITRFAAQPRWKNGGTTPTENLTIQVNWRGPSGPIPPEYTYREGPIPFFLGPQAIQASVPTEMTGAQALVNWQWNPIPPSPQMFIWGRADYRDVFGESHFVEWCYELRLSRPIRSERIRAEFIQWGEYNRSDKSS